MFDPYGQWLNISKERRPVTYYLLLGIDPSEQDPDVIDASAQEQASLVRKHQHGPHAAAAAQILKEIDHARVTLLNPTTRRDYDARLKKALADRAAKAAMTEDFEVVEDEPVAEVDDAKPVKRSAKLVEMNPNKPKAADKKVDGKKAEPIGKKKSKKGDESKPKSKLPLIILAGGALVLLLLVTGSVGAYFLFFNKKDPESAAVSPSTKQETPVVPSAPPTTRRSDPPKTNPAPPPKPEPPKPEPPKPTPPPPPKPEPPKPEKPKIVKLAVPPDSELTAAETKLKEDWKVEYAKPKPEDKLVLASKFLVPGREDRKNPAAWFVLLREARDLAIQAKRPRLAAVAIDDIDTYFIVDAVEMRIKMLADISKGASEVQSAAVFRTAQNLIQQAYFDEKFDAAKRYLDTAETAVREAKGDALLRLLRDQKAELGEYTREYESVTAARKKLQETPNDADANLIVGRFTCFFQADWDKGLPMLAMGSNAGLKDLAKKDLARPAETADRLAVGDAWWNQSRPLRDREKMHVMKHARLWYERAGPGVLGDDRTRVIDRVMEQQRVETVRFQRLLPGSYFGRGAEDRVLLLREGGGNAKSEDAIESGLEWLAKHQSASGAWTTDKFQTAGKCKCADHSEGEHNVAGTAFGLMPFLGVGQTHRSGKYAKNIERALNYLMSQQKPEGNFHANPYENALATIAFIELYALSKDGRMRDRAVAATNYLVRSQISDGGWGNSGGAGPTSDVSVMGWQFTALKAAAYAGFVVPQETFDRLTKLLDKTAEPSGLGYGYNSPGAGPSTSAVGILCRQFLQWGPGHPGLVKAVDHLMQTGNYPAKDRISMYSVYYITQVAHHLGGDHWEKWNATVRDLLIELQDKGDVADKAHQKGSWAPNNDPYAKQGGRIMFTSLALITLEAYYYHIPLYGYGPYVLKD